LPAAVKLLFISALSADCLAWQYRQAFLVALVYSGLANVAVVETRKPPSKMAAGTITFQWDMMPPKREFAIASPRVNCLFSDGIRPAKRPPAGQLPRLAGLVLGVVPQRAAILSLIAL